MEISREVKMKKIISILLLLIVLISSVACGSAKTAAEIKTPIAVNTAKKVETPDVYEAAGDIYERELLLLPDAEVSLSDAVISGETIYLYGTADKEPLLYRLEVSNQNFEKLEFPQEIMTYKISASINGGVCLLGINEDGTYVLLALDGDSAWTKLTLPMLDDYKDDIVTQIIPVENGYIVFTSSKILAVDFQGNKLKDLGNYYRYGACFPQDDGGMIITAQVMDGSETHAAQVKTSVLDSDFNVLENYESSWQFTAFYGYAEGQNHILCRQAGTVFSFDYKNNTVEAVIDASSSGISPSHLIQLEDDLYFSLSNGKPYLWHPYDKNSLSTLTLATYMPDINLTDYVKLYNESSTKYKIIIIDYAAYDQGSERQGLSRLRTDIIAGRTPDIYDLSNLPAHLYAERGIFEDFKPYLTAGSPISYEQLIPSATKALEYKGGLYYIAPAFEIKTICGNKSFVGGNGTWTPQDFFRAVEEIKPEDVFGPEVTKAVFLSYLLEFLEDEYVDTETAQCRFDNENFVRFLEFASQLPDECDYNELDSSAFGRAYVGKQPLLIEEIGVSAISFMSFVDSCFGGRAQYVGFPTDSSSGVALSPALLLAMSVSSQQKEGVMDFIYFLLSDEVQRTTVFCPLVQSILIEQMNCWEEQIYKYPQVLHAFFDGASVEIEGNIDPAEAKLRLSKLIDSIDHTTLYDDELFDIIFRESQPFFAGNISAKQAAENIQSKAQLYVSEQYG